jgi:hypothetical protein
VTYAISHTFRHLLLRWTNFVRRQAWIVMSIAVMATVIAAVFVTGNFAVNSSTEHMLSPDLPHRRAAQRTEGIFGGADNNLLIVVDGASADQVEAAVASVAYRMRQQPRLFRKVVDFQSLPFFRQNGLLYLDINDLEVLADRLAEAQPFLGALWRDPTLRGLFDVLALAAEQTAAAASTPPIDLAPVLDKVAAVVEAQTAGRPVPLSWSGLIAGDTAAAGTRRFIMADVVPDFGRFRAAQSALTAVREILDDLRLDGSHGVRARLTGSVALNDDELVSAAVGAGVSSAASFVLVVLILIACFHSPRMTLAAVVTLIFGLLWTAAWAVLVVGALNLISVAFAVLFIGLSVDFSIHYALRYREARERTGEHPRSLVMAASSCGGALTLAASAAAIGFLSFLPTDYRGLAELGLIAGSSMLIALLATFTVMPAMLTIVVPRLRQTVEWRERRDRDLADWVDRHRRAILVATGVLAGAALTQAPQVRFDFDPLHLKDPGSESVSTLLDLLAEEPGTVYSVVAVAADLNEASRLAARVAALPTVSGTRTAESFVPSAQNDKLPIIADIALLLEPSFSAPRRSIPTREETLAALRNLQESLRSLAVRGEGAAAAAAGRLLATLGDWVRATGADARALRGLENSLLQTLPEQIELLRQSLRAENVAIATLPEVVRRDWLAADGRAKLAIYPKEPVHRDPAALQRFVDDVRSVIPDAVGDSIGIFEASRAVVRAFVEAVVIAVSLIAAIVVLLLRSLRLTILVFLPLVLAGLMTMATSVLLGIPFNFANVIVLPLLFGLGVAGSLHLVIRDRKERGESEALSTSTPRAVMFSALTTIASFGSLALSQHPGTASMGILLTVALTFTLGATLLTLPAVMMATSRRIPKPPAPTT